MVKSKKRKDPEELGDAPPIKKDDDSSDEEMEILDVDFEWFDPKPIDFHGFKMLLRQLLDIDNQMFNLSELADLILAQTHLGSTVKVDGEESDPYAFMTVLNMQQHKDKKVIKDLAEYFVQKAASEPSLSQLPSLLSPENSSAQVGLILTERFINMPSEIVPPLYKMLLDDIQTAKDDGEPCNFTHYLIPSKTYVEVESKLDMEESRPTKKTKNDGSSETFFFHPEDEILHKHALAHANFEYTKQADEGASDAKRAFQEMGIKPQGHLILIEAKKLAGAVNAVQQAIGGPAAAS